jgi:hypothetical protein
MNAGIYVGENIRGDLTRSFLQEFAVASELGLYLNGSLMTRFKAGAVAAKFVAMLGFYPRLLRGR